MDIEIKKYPVLRNLKETREFLSGNEKAYERLSMVVL